MMEVSTEVTNSRLLNGQEGCDSRGMEEMNEGSDDEEQPLVIAEEENGRSPSSIQVTNPFSKMVAVPSEAEAPAQGSTTPRPADGISEQAPEVETPAVEDRTDRAPDPLSSDDIQASLEKVLAATGTMAPPDVNFDQNMWGNLWSANGSSQPSMLSPIFTTLSEAERSKLITDLIINCIQQQRALWDSTHQNFGDSKLCPLLWSNIASVCGYDVKKLKNKWWNLRSVYRREYLKSQATGVTSKSPNFAAMSFLEGEIKLELERLKHEKQMAAMQLLRRMGDTELRGDGGNSRENDDCMIVDGEAEEGSPRDRTIPRVSGPSSLVKGSKGDPGTQSQPSSAQKPPAIRPRDLSELRRLPLSGSRNSDPLETRRSPEIICLGEPKEPQATAKNHYTAVPGQPVIKYNTVNNPPSKPEVKILVEDGMPKNWKEDNEQPKSPSLSVKQSAKKSISRANLTLFPKQNGVAHSSTSGKTVAGSWKTENPITLREVSLTKVEPLAHKVVQPKKESIKEENKKIPKDARTTLVTKKPKAEPVDDDDDDIQIIEEVTRSAAVKQPPSDTRPGTSERPAPPKRARVSSELPDTPSQPATKRKVDKNRENSSSEHFLLSLLCDVETMTNAQFRRFKERSTALVSMIMDRR